MAETILDVPYHAQLDTDTCGAACLKMTLEAIQGDSDTEAALFAETHSAVWGGSSPDNLADALKTRGGAKASSVAVVKETGTHREAELVVRMIWSIRDAGVPPIALVAFSPQSTTGDGHWVVVAGYVADRHPTGPEDTQVAISQIFMNNPLQIGDQVYPEHVTYKTWRKRYMKPVGNKEDYEGSVVAVAAGSGGAS